MADPSSSSSGPGADEKPPARPAPAAPPADWAELGRSTWPSVLELPPARLMALHENELVEEIPIRSPVITIGRDGANDVPVPTNRASLWHARIIYREGQFWIQDLGSVNGTQLDGEIIRDPRALHHGSIIKIGTSILKFLAGSE